MMNKQCADKRCFCFLFFIGMLWVFVVVPAHVLAQDQQAQELANRALEDIKHSISVSQERSQQLREEVSRLQQDQKSLIQALSASVMKERDLSIAVFESEGRLKKLLMEKIEREHALQLRREEFSDVLVMLERMGLRPPPAILIEADDALQSLRGSILLSSIVLQLRELTQALTASLNELERIEKSLVDEQEQLMQDMKAQQEEKQRLELLSAEKARLQQQSEKNLEELEVENRRLEKKAKSLTELVQELDKQASKKRALQQPSSDEGGLLALKDNFSQMRGSLMMPAAGSKVQVFDADFPGELYETEPDSAIITPAEGVVRYVGSFRSYGQMLILDVGQNYHLVLAGMGRIDVKTGQILFAGEPVGVMGSGDPHTQESPSNNNRIDSIIKPALYVELRKDGASINPAPWWAK